MTQVLRMTIKVMFAHEEMESMKMGAVGATWQRASSALLPARVLGGPRAMAALQGSGSPGVSQAEEPRVSGMARPCLINFRPLPSRIISALNLF